MEHIFFIKKRSILMLLILVAFHFFSCSENEEINHPPVEVKFELLNEKGEPTTVFKEGEDIIFDYYIINKSNSTLIWYFKDDFNYQNMFKIYKVIPPNSEIPQGEVIEIGTPQTSEILIDFRGGHPIESEIQFKMSWKGNDLFTIMPFSWHLFYNEKAPLSPGSYKIKFEQKIEIASFDDLKIEFNKDFKVIENN